MSKPLSETNTIGSRLLHPFREIGMVCNGVPGCVKSVNTDSLIVTSIGQAYHMYLASKLSLLFVGPQLPGHITCLDIGNHHVYAAVGGDIWGLKRGKVSFRARICETLAQDSVLTHILKLGQLFICGVAFGQHTQVYVCEKSKAPQLVKLPFRPNNKLTHILHPHTYLNKVLVCTSSGKVHIVNIRTLQTVYTFNIGGEIVSVGQSGVVDVVAFGLRDGRVVVHNIKLDTQVCVFNHSKTQGIPVSLSFRTDEIPQLAVGCSSGDVVVWNLETRKLATIIQKAQDSDVSTCVFLVAQPILVTAASDNALKMWIFDQSDDSARLLRSRDGHSSPPTTLHYYDPNGLQILSGSNHPALRLTSTVKDARNTAFSLSNAFKQSRGLEVSKAPGGITQIAFNVQRAAQWNNIVTVHKGQNVGFLWSFDKKSVAQKLLKPKPSTATSTNKPEFQATSVAVSWCGNFTFLGTSDGTIHKFNLESGLYRTSTATSSPGKGHSRDVTGLSIDTWGRQLVSCSLDGSVRFWGAKSLTHEQTLELNTPLTAMTAHPKSGLIAVAGDNFASHVIDTATQRLVRIFGSRHTDCILGQAFSHDGRLLAVCSADGTMTVWRLPTATLIDWIRFDSVPTAVAFSPQSDMIATCHANCLAISLWINKSLYQPVFHDSPPAQPTHVTHQQLASNAFAETAPESDSDTDGDWMAIQTHAHHSDSDDDINNNNNDDSTLAPNHDAIDTLVSDDDTGNASGDKKGEKKKKQNDQEESKKPVRDRDGMYDGLASLSGLPRAHWHSLRHHDTIRKRNKPDQPPEQPQLAPFFLQAMLPESSSAKGTDFFLGANTQQPQSLPPPSDSNQTNNKRSKTDTPSTTTTATTATTGISKILGSNSTSHLSTSSTKTRFVRALESCNDTDALAILSSLSPSATHLEIQLMDLASGPSLAVCFLQFVLRQLHAKRNIELVHAVLGVFLQHHALAATQYPMAMRVMRELECEARESWQEIHALMSSNICLVQFFSNVQA
eukprot:c11420_g1_i2.p1 GENE.c11420_g1_i2~~c11420_g1_i2.p1  ORF type:complete len:1037 (+),score=314.16 c11420_g1_i2:88-3111(+)